MILRPGCRFLAVSLLVPLAAACTPKQPPSTTGVPPPATSQAPSSPTPNASPTPTPSPSPSPTPSQQDLSAQAEKAYRTASGEFERLAREGGTSEASPVLRSVAAERALLKYVALLNNQKERRYTVTGTGQIHTKPQPGSVSYDSDPRLSLQVCDDRSAVRWTEGGQTMPGYPVQGWAYGRLIDGKVMIVDVETSRVERCDLS